MEHRSYWATGNDGNGNESGHVRVYRYDGIDIGTTGQDIDGEAPHDGSGISVSLNNSGDYIVVGAPGNDGNGNSNGHVRVYGREFDNETWEQAGADIDAEDPTDFSGESVSLSSDGTIVAVGASW